MARTRRRESAWLERLRYKYELIRRDPQAQKVLKLYESDSAAAQPRTPAWEQAEALGRALALKYGVPVTLAGLRSRGTGVLNPEFPITFTVNGGHVAPALAKDLRPPGDRGPNYGPWVLTHDPHRPWEHAPVVSELCFQVDVTKVTLWDKEGLASEFRTLLLRCLPFALKAPRKRRGQAELAVIRAEKFGPYYPQPPPGTTHESRRSREEPTRWEYHMKLPPGAPTTYEVVTPKDWRVITVLVNVGEVTKHDLTRLTRDFKKEVLDRWLPQAPNAPRLGAASEYDYVDGLGRHNPAELDFLHNVRPEQFYRDLRRYDLHMKHRLSFRLIAALERLEQTGHPIPDAPRPRQVGRSIRGEDSVEASVQRIYLAIHRTPYLARRHRLDAPAEGQEEYRCAEHGRECPETCPQLQRWWDEVRSTLPSDHTGMLRSVPLHAFLSPEGDEVRRPSTGWVRQPRRQD